MTAFEDMSMFPEIPADAGLWTGPMHRPDETETLVGQLFAELTAIDTRLLYGRSVDFTNEFRARKLIERGWRPTQETAS